MKKIGILGGTFNPPHIGHLMIAEQVKDQLDLAEVWFIPTYFPPHKQKSNTTVDQRIKMLEKSIDNNNSFSINLIEVERKGTSYTIDTIKILKERFPNLEFYFIIGADMVEYLPNWKKIDELVELITFVGVRRSNYLLKSPYPIKVVDVPIIEISSTDIRRRVKNKQSIKYLVTDSVLEYIGENHLYED